MPLELLGPLVVLGIGVIVLIVWLLADTKPQRLQNENQIRQIFLDDFPAVQFGSKSVIAKDGNSALLEISSPEKHLGLIVTLGSKHVTRCLAAADCVMLECNDGNRIKLTFPEFTFKTVSFECDGNQDFEHACILLKTIAAEVKLPNQEKH